MYLPSNTPILQDQRDEGVRRAVQSEKRVANMRRTSACGRTRLFNTLVSPTSVADRFGIGTAVNVAKLQRQTRESRASATLGTDYAALNSPNAPSVAEIITNAPEVVSMSRQGGACEVQVRQTYTPRPALPSPQAGMPHRAPVMVPSSLGTGTMYFKGAPSTVQADYNQGLTGYAPPWSDAGVLPDGGVPQSGVSVGQWIMDHPWLALLLAGGGVYALSRRDKR